MANLIIFLRNDNYKKKSYIFSLILIITLPFLIIFFYQKNFTRVENRLFNSEEGIFVFNKYELPQNILNLDKLDFDKLDFSTLNKFCLSHNTSLDKFFGGRICGWEILTKLYFQNLKFFGYGFFDDRRILKKIQKISSNSYIFVLFNAGIVSFLIIIIFYVNIFFKMIKSYNLLKINNSTIIIPLYYVLLTGYLIARSFFEDTLAFMSVDFLLLINCIVFFNYFFYTSSILDKKDKH